MVEYVSTCKMEIKLRPIGFRAFSLLVELKWNTVIVYLSTEVVSKLQSKHEFVTVSYTLNSSFSYRASVNFNDFVTGKRIKLRGLTNINLGVFIDRLTQHLPLLAEILLITDKSLLACLTPDSDALVTTDCY